jgi:hypothetical protein
MPTVPACALAAVALIGAWRHSPLPLESLKRLRARAEAARDAGRLWGELLCCPYCLAFWVTPALLIVAAHPVGRVAVEVLAGIGLVVAVFLVAGRTPPH